MKNNKLFIMHVLLSGTVLFMTPVQANEDNSRWSAFGTASDIEPGQTGLGGGAAINWEWQEDVFLTGRATAATYDDADRVQLLAGGEWVDRGPRFNGYIGAHVGADVFRSDLSDSEDLFARFHYDVGWKATPGSELRIGISYDVLTDHIERKGGLRAGWYTQSEDGVGFFVSGEVYENESNVFAGLSWPL